MTTEELIERLASHRTIGQAPREELAWIAAHGFLRRLEAGAVVSRHTEVVDGLYILLSGQMSIYVTRGTARRKVMEWREGDVTGVLPYSRMTNPPGDTIVEETADVFTVLRTDLPGLIRNCHEVTASLVHVMTDRARRFTSTDLRDEKMKSLGKLAAGLAHELNNPASAALRDAKSLAATLLSAEEAARALGAARLSSEQQAELDAVRDFCVTTMNPAGHTGLELADREDAIDAWLTSHGVNQASAEDLARTPITLEALDRLGRVMPAPALDAALRWIAGGCAAHALVADIERAASRIHALVAAVKGFTHMDRPLDQDVVDISGGLTDTVALLAGKARAKSVAIALHIAPTLPRLRGNSVEVNQIWMNLIDNAIDAAPSNGHVTVTASREGAGIVVRVEDDGSGIDPSIKESIFDPFFTTKAIGEGTGLGLDIVRRIVQWHKGEIDVDSQPGRTVFRVRFPVAGGG